MACGSGLGAWEAECLRQLEVHKRYVELVRFRSGKCRLPGRACGYADADVRLMWQYIENTAPLCGKLIKALAVVEERFRRLGLAGLENGYKVEVSRPDKLNPNREIITLYLKKPVYATIALWEEKLYVFYDGVLIEDSLRKDELEEMARKAVQAGIAVEVYDIDEEYKRLWLEVPLPKTVSRLLGGRDRAPVALFRNLGWLLSDDWRREIRQAAGNFGQVALRLFDWIALAEYAVERGIAPRAPLAFRLAIRKATKSGGCENPTVDVRPIGATYDALNTTYEWFGITLGKTEGVLARGYSVLKAVREETFKREGKMYVVNDVGAWIAFSNVVDVLVVGDGYITPVELRVVAKASPRATLEGETTLVKELANAVGGAAVGKEVKLQSWHMRLLLPTPPTPAFEKTTKLYEVLTNYPIAAVVEVNGATYLLTHNGGGEFVIGRGKATELYEAVEGLGIKARFKRKLLLLTYAQLEELVRRGLSVRFLTDMEKDAIREVKPATSIADVEAIRHVLEEITKMARIVVAKKRGQLYIRIIPHDKSKVEEIAAMLRAVGIRASILRKKREVRIHERRSVEIIRKVAPAFFALLQRLLHFAIIPPGNIALRGVGRHALSLPGSLQKIRINVTCGGWDLNPRRPAPQGPQPCPFDLARAPPPIVDTRGNLNFKSLSCPYSCRRV